MNIAIDSQAIKEDFWLENFDSKLFFTPKNQLNNSLFVSEIAIDEALIAYTNKLKYKLFERKKLDKELSILLKMDFQTEDINIQFHTAKYAEFLKNSLKQLNCDIIPYPSISHKELLKSQSKKSYRTLLIEKSMQSHETFIASQSRTVDSFCRFNGNNLLDELHSMNISDYQFDRLNILDCLKANLKTNLNYLNLRQLFNLKNDKIEILVEDINIDFNSLEYESVWAINEIESVVEYSIETKIRINSSDEIALQNLDINIEKIPVNLHGLILFDNNYKIISSKIKIVDGPNGFIVNE